MNGAQFVVKNMSGSLSSINGMVRLLWSDMMGYKKTPHSEVWI
ncbi:Putative protein [Zobellia galactanivorans]|uniref:Uncharacterized protein n=1 Tax=Zobellia galactanivorans (strain DSM 12802 / CCUG 47099 / CIP 106680 / NCIMB 13871 / Dsij) TaxID=63186 RepID=G0L3X3_ZOBGA|nr:Putative protein [Zobellia galactanivorans]